jgi:hypothetical protein
MKQRITKITILPQGEPIFSEQATHVEIEDEAGGEFITVSQPNGGKIGIEYGEWLELRTVIGKMFREIEKRRLNK